MVDGKEVMELCDDGIHRIVWRMPSVKKKTNRRGLKSNKLGGKHAVGRFDEQQPGESFAEYQIRVSRFPKMSLSDFQLPQIAVGSSSGAAAAVQDGSVGSSAGAAAVQDDVGDWNLISRDQLSTY